MTTRITIDLPTPPTIISPRGFKHIELEDIYERSHAERAMISINGDTMSVQDAEEYALKILWLVREHYHGEGLACEVTDEHEPEISIDSADGDDEHSDG